MIDILLVDDSPVVRAYLAYLLEDDPSFRVSRTAENGHQAVASVLAARPDLVLMDIHMPGMDGFEAARQIMATTPVPIVLITASSSGAEVATAMQGLGVGALAVLKKPGGPGTPGSAEETAELIKTVRLMSQVAVVGRRNPSAPAGSAEVGAARRRELAVVAIGASTGGPPALLSLLSGLPEDFPAPLLVVQHMTSGFTVALAAWLASECGLPVSLAQDGERPLPAHVYLAPEDRHLTVGPQGTLLLSDEPPQDGLCPAVGVLFRSVASVYGSRAAAVLLSGMGRDGAAELKRLAELGALTIVQDQASSIVHGMPDAAIQLGAAGHVLAPAEIAELLVTTARKAG